MSLRSVIITTVSIVALTLIYPALSPAGLVHQGHGIFLTDPTWAYGQRDGTGVDNGFRAVLTDLKSLSIQNLYIYAGNLTADGRQIQNRYTSSLEFPAHLADILRVVRQFQDVNGDGQVTPDERLFNIYAWVRGSTDWGDLEVNPDAPQVLFPLYDAGARQNLALLLRDLTYGSDVLNNNHGLTPEMNFDGVVLDLEPIPAADFADEYYPGEMGQRYENFLLLLSQINQQGVGLNRGVNPLLAVAVNPWTADGNVTPATFTTPLKYQWDSISFAGIKNMVDEILPMAFEPYPLQGQWYADPPRFTIDTYDIYIRTNLDEISLAASSAAARLQPILPSFSNDIDPYTYGNFSLGLDGVLAFSQDSAALVSSLTGVTIFDHYWLEDFEVDQFTNFLANLPDRDGDGLDDLTERNVGSNVAVADTDGDALTDYQEVVTYGSDPNIPDTDNDGLTDYQEAIVYHTAPFNPDTDDDGLTDYEEVATYNTDPTLADTDSDGLTDSEELLTYYTDPRNADTDSDGYNDGDEIAAGTDPLDPYSYPAKKKPGRGKGGNDNPNKGGKKK